MTPLQLTYPAIPLPETEQNNTRRHTRNRNRGTVAYQRVLIQTLHLGSLSCFFRPARRYTRPRPHAAAVPQGVRNICTHTALLHLHQQTDTHFPSTGARSRANPVTCTPERFVRRVKLYPFIAPVSPTRSRGTIRPEQLFYRCSSNEPIFRGESLVLLHRVALFVLCLLVLLLATCVHLAVGDEDVFDRLQQPPEVVEKRQLPAHAQSNNGKNCALAARL